MGIITVFVLQGQMMQNNFSEQKNPFAVLQKSFLKLLTVLVCLQIVFCENALSDKWQLPLSASLLNLQHRNPYELVVGLGY